MAAEAEGAAMEIKPPTRARRTKIDPVKWQPEHLTERAILERTKKLPPIKAAPTIETAAEVSSSSSSSEEEEDVIVTAPIVSTTQSKLNGKIVQPLAPNNESSSEEEDDEDQAEEQAAILTELKQNMDPSALSIERTNQLALLQSILQQPAPAELTSTNAEAKAVKREEIQPVAKKQRRIDAIAATMAKTAASTTPAAPAAYTPVPRYVPPTPSEPVLAPTAEDTSSEEESSSEDEANEGEMQVDPKVEGKGAKVKMESLKSMFKPKEAEGALLPAFDMHQLAC